eukprot:9346242-Pyramimonas_sp.AAC.1
MEDKTRDDGDDEVEEERSITPVPSLTHASLHLHAPSSPSQRFPWQSFTGPALPLGDTREAG